MKKPETSRIDFFWWIASPSEMKNIAKKTKKTGAERKRDYDERQRQRGRRPLQLWVTPEENKKIREFLGKLRNETRG